MNSDKNKYFLLKAIEKLEPEDLEFFVCYFFLSVKEMSETSDLKDRYRLAEIRDKIRKALANDIIPNAANVTSYLKGSFDRIVDVLAEDLGFKDEKNEDDITKTNNYLLIASFRQRPQEIYGDIATDVICHIPSGELDMFHTFDPKEGLNVRVRRSGEAQLRIFLNSQKIDKNTKQKAELVFNFKSVSVSDIGVIFCMPARGDEGELMEVGQKNLSDLNLGYHKEVVVPIPDKNFSCICIKPKYSGSFNVSDMRIVYKENL